MWRAREFSRFQQAGTGSPMPGFRTPGNLKIPPELSHSRSDTPRKPLSTGGEDLDRILWIEVRNGYEPLPHVAATEPRIVKPSASL